MVTDTPKIGSMFPQKHNNNLFQTCFLFRWLKFDSKIVHESDPKYTIRFILELYTKKYLSF